MAGKLLPMDIGALMAQKFTEMQHRANAMTGDWFPKVAPPSGVDVLPREVRAAIVQALQAAQLLTDEKTIEQVYRAYLEGLRAAQQAE